MMKFFCVWCPHFKSSNFYPRFRKGTRALAVVMRAVSRLNNDPATDWIRLMLCMLNKLNHDASSAAMQFLILRRSSSIRSIQLTAARCVLCDAECILPVLDSAAQRSRSVPAAFPPELTRWGGSTRTSPAGALGTLCLTGRI